LKWWVIAGDGMGEVHARLSTDGSLNFTNAMPITLQQPTIAALGYFKLSVIVPNVKCTGPNNTCIMQFWTDSGGGWYSCTTLNITCTGCAGGIPISHDDCVQSGKLNFCSSKSNSQVFVPEGQSAAQIDGLTEGEFNQNHPNPNVFSNGNSSQCLSQYQQFLCALYFSPCGNSTSSYTKQQCNQAMATCGLTSLHADLYNCSVFPSAATVVTPFVWIAMLFVVTFIL
jgi:hypothetical protein